MRKCALIVVAVALSTMTPSTQSRAVVVVKSFTAAGSTGTLAHPIAQKIADRIKESKLK
jgi:hypothetical protein